MIHTLTPTCREMFKGWQLPPRRPALGVQMVGDMAYVLIPPSAPVPAIGRQVGPGRPVPGSALHPPTFLLVAAYIIGKVGCLH
jgi:hypothetical protein